MDTQPNRSDRSNFTGFILVGIVFLIVGSLAGYLYEKRKNDSLNTQLSDANTKIQLLTPNTTGLFDPTKATIGEKPDDNWTVSSIDKDTGFVHLLPTNNPAVITGLFFNEQDGGPCLQMEQLGLESGTLPSTVIAGSSTFCASDDTAAAVTAKFGSVKSHSWASIEVTELVYTDHGVIGKISKVDSITPLADNLGTH